MATEEEAPPKVVNLMDALRQSLDRVSTGKKKAAKADMTDSREAREGGPEEARGPLMQPAAGPATQAHCHV